MCTIYFADYKFIIFINLKISEYNSFIEWNILILLRDLLKLQTF